MHNHLSHSDLAHSHGFGQEGATRSEHRTLLVVGLTVVMMLAEIIGGALTGSMALLADGWHMGSHAAALGLAAFAYRFARRHAHDRRFCLGPRKVRPPPRFARAIPPRPTPPCIGY